MRRDSPWEQGSEFAWPALVPHASESPAPWGGGHLLYGSGRDALRGLLIHGRTVRSWRRLWIPSYFCQEVVTSLFETGVEFAAYPDAPTNPTLDLSDINFNPGDVLLSVNFFGLRSRTIYPVDRARIEILEDHTHDPWSDWSYSTDADWCVASLRKTLPISDGGVLWSPRGHPLPSASPVTATRELASLRKLAGMLLKGLYIDGFPVEKTAFRQLATTGEEILAAGPVSGMPEWTRALLPLFPITLWREKRRTNHAFLCAELSDVACLSVLRPSSDLGSCPFAVAVVFDSSQRGARVRNALIAADIYPAALWSLDCPEVEGIPKEHVDLARRMLLIHCDARYDEDDLCRVAATIREACNEAANV